MPGHEHGKPSGSAGANAGQSKRYVFTWNNYSAGDFEKCKSWISTNAIYGIVGEEVGESGTRHLQGYFRCKRSYRITQLRKAMPAHFAVARGNDLENQKYCSKDGKFWEHGTPAKGPGARSDISAATKMLRRNMGMREVAISHPEVFVKYSRGLQQFNQVVNGITQRSWKTEVVVLVGKPGTGKSRYANAWASFQYGESVYYKPRGEWWDGYDGQHCVIMDDFYGWIKYDELLKICDRYPYRVPIKGGYQPFLARKIYITSNAEPYKWYQKLYEKQGITDEAMLRRFDLLFIDEVPALPPVTAVKPEAAEGSELIVIDSDSEDTEDYITGTNPNQQVADELIEIAEVDDVTAPPDDPWGESCPITTQDIEYGERMEELYMHNRELTHSPDLIAWLNAGADIITPSPRLDLTCDTRPVKAMQDDFDMFLNTPMCKRKDCECSECESDIDAY